MRIFDFCPECDELVPVDMETCTNCGARLDSEEPEIMPSDLDSPDFKHCPQCDLLLEISAERCFDCGYEFRAGFESDD